MVVKIVIESIPHDQHRYPTTGDYWQDEDGTLQVRVSNIGPDDERMQFLVALHEMIEMTLCAFRGIAEPDIKAWDEAVPDDSPYADDPGHDPTAPYHKEHVFAECIERLVAAELGVNWQKYEERCDALYADG
jgi:hypothetical protein